MLWFSPFEIFPFSQLHSAISKIMANIEYVCCASAPLVSKDRFLLSILWPSLSLDSDISFPIHEWLLYNGCLGQFNSNSGQPQDIFFFLPSLSRLRQLLAYAAISDFLFERIIFPPFMIF